MEHKTHTDLQRITIAGGLSFRQKLFGIVFLLIVGGGLYLSIVHTVALIVSVLITLFALSFLVTIRLMVLSKEGEVEIPLLLSDDDCPDYTILVPVRHEVSLIDQIITSLSQLDYPSDKVTILVIADEDDTGMCEAIAKTQWPAQFTPIIVPNDWKGTVAKPAMLTDWVRVLSKPRSLNYAAFHDYIQGEYTVIYDAEDHPEVDQLRKAATIFHHHPELTCLQAELRWWNAFQTVQVGRFHIPNIFTRGVAAGYGFHFALKLAGLARSKGVFPLGGTSNHIRTEALTALGYWDPYNVTEDLDLGVKLARAGYASMVFSSVTWEEATSSFRTQVRQNSRWIKGHTATFIAHTRDPLALVRDLGVWGTITFVTCVAFSHPAVLCAPLFWIGMVLYALTKADVIEQITPAYTFYLGTLCFLGNGAYLWLTMLSAMKTKQYRLIPWISILPIYWALVLVSAAWLAMREVMRGEWYVWHKTAHVLTYTVPVERKEELHVAVELPANVRDFSEYKRKRDLVAVYKEGS